MAEKPQFEVLWEKIKERAEKLLTAITFTTYFEPLVPVDVINKKLILRAPGETAAVQAGGGAIELPCRAYAPAVTEEVLRERTRLLASFSTRYSAKNLPRSHNIALATERISGTRWKCSAIMTWL